MRRKFPDKQLVNLLVGAVREKQYFVLFLVAVLVVTLLMVQHGCPKAPPKVPNVDEPEDTTPVPPPGPGSYLFCFWNVENLFDDKDDNRRARGDAEYDEYFAHDKAALAQKLNNLCAVLLGLNDGKGPDVLAVAEIESERAVDLLRRALNQRLRDPALRYRALVYEQGSGGRNIAPAILSRLPVDASRTQLLDKRMRILQAQVTVVDQPLVLLASHWTSRISDEDGDRRAVYADRLYGRYRQMRKANPQVDLLICGDFNDNPDDPSVTEHLHATGDERRVQGDGKPLLFNLFAKPYADGEASHYYGAKPFLFDQVVVSPGMLDDEGWSCEVGSARVIKEMATRQGRPNRFGGGNDKRALSARGASDHFPVTVRLRVR